MPLKKNLLYNSIGPDSLLVNNFVTAEEGEEETPEE